MHEYFAGCDTHKEKHFFSVINCRGEVQESFEIANSLKGWNEALSKIQKYPNILCGIENSANFARKFSKFLLKKEIKVKEVNPVFTGKKRKAHTCLNKTDQIDSVVIAKITRDEQDYLPDIQVNQESEELKAITRQREELVKEQTRVKNRLHAKLTQIDPQYKEKYGKLGNKGTIKKLEATFKKTSDILERLLFQDIELLKNMYKEIGKLEKMLIEKEHKNELIQNLDTLNGVDTVTACKMVGIIGDISKFKSPDKLASYAGISPVEKSSGKSSKKFRNCKANRRLNTVFYMIALTQIKHFEVASNYYQKKLNEGKTKKQAIHCLMRRLVKIIWMMYKHNQPYKYQEIKQAQYQILQAA
jgi:transposase